LGLLNLVCPAELTHMLGSSVMRAMKLSRRAFLTSFAAAGGAALLRPMRARAQAAPLTKPIPSTGEALPLIGLGSWITFNVGTDPAARDACTEVMRAFFEDGGRMIDSSPMYGSSQAVIGYGLKKLGHPQTLFSADKVWISSGEDGPAQIEESRAHWGVAHFDLLQVHNLVGGEEHLQTLFAMKEAGSLRYIGITTSHGRRHGEFEEIMRKHPLDFVQLTYNVLDRKAEKRLLPLAREKGIAVIANRPFQQGVLIRGVEGQKLPQWAGEIGAENWAQFLLKFIVSHPAVTCAIPATSQLAHVRENIGAARGPLPDEAMRRRMIAYVEEIA
jgi:diketogulonate reductase-like aldo/keto reductase